jgi:hypothetical protein
LILPSNQGGFYLILAERILSPRNPSSRASRKIIITAIWQCPAIDGCIVPGRCPATGHRFFIDRDHNARRRPTRKKDSTVTVQGSRFADLANAGAAVLITHQRVLERSVSWIIYFWLPRIRQRFLLATYFRSRHARNFLMSAECAIP